MTLLLMGGGGVGKALSLVVLPVYLLAGSTAIAAQPALGAPGKPGCPVQICASQVSAPCKSFPLRFNTFHLVWRWKWGTPLVNFSGQALTDSQPEGLVDGPVVADNWPIQVNMASNPDGGDVSQVEGEDTDGKTDFAIRIAPEHLFNFSNAKADSFPQLCSIAYNAMSHFLSSDISFGLINIVNPARDGRFTASTNNLEVFARAKHLEANLFSVVVLKESSRNCVGWLPPRVAADMRNP